MKNINITFRMDDELKKLADIFFEDLGMSLSTAINIFVRQAVREQQIPFQISKATPNTVTLSAIESSEKGEDIYGPYSNIADLMEALNA